MCECVFHKYYLDKRLWLKATPFKAATLEINQPVYKVHIFSTETDNHRGEQRGHRSNTPGTQSRAVLSHLQVMNARSWSHLVQVIYSHYLCAWFCFPNLDTSFTYIKLQIPGFDICKGSLIKLLKPFIYLFIFYWFCVFFLDFSLETQRDFWSIPRSKPLVRDFL